MSGLKRASYSRPILLASAAATVAASLVFVTQDESPDTPPPSTAHETGGPSQPADIQPAFASASASATPVLPATVDAPSSAARPAPAIAPDRMQTKSRPKVRPPMAELAYTDAPEASPLAHLADPPATPEPTPALSAAPAPPAQAPVLAPSSPIASGESTIVAADPEDGIELYAGEPVTAGPSAYTAPAPGGEEPGARLTEAELLVLSAVQSAAQDRQGADADGACAVGSDETILPTSAEPARCDADEQFVQELPAGGFASPDLDPDDVLPALAAIEGPDGTPNACSAVLDPRDCPGTPAAMRQASASPPGHGPQTAGMTHYTIGVSVGGRAAQPVPILIDRSDNILIGVSGLLASVRSLMDPAVYARLATSSAASTYVNVEKLRALGFAINFDDRQNALVLTAR